MSLLVKEASILTMDSSSPFIKEGYVFIENGCFHTLGSNQPPTELQAKASKIINAKGKWIIPGLINSHGHAGMSLLRGHSDDLPLQRWLQEKMWPFEKNLDKESVQAGRALAMAEMIKSGTTTFLEMYHLFMDDFAQKIEEVGLRATLMRSMIGLCPKEEQEEKLSEAVTFSKSWHMRANGRIQTMLAPHAPYTCPLPFIIRIVEEAHNLHVPVHMHLAETKKEIDEHIKQHGMHPLDQLKENKLLQDVSWLFAHAVHLDSEHIEILHEANASVSHNPISNLKLGSGIAPIASMLKKGVNVSLGTDSVASNNTLDLFEEMRMAALIHKGFEQDPTLLSAEQVLRLATTAGARALHFENVGQIKVGFDADFVMISSEALHLQPAQHVASHLIYAAKSSDVTDVFVQGKALMEDRQLLTLDEEKIIAEANVHYHRIAKML